MHSKFGVVFIKRVVFLNSGNFWGLRVFFGCLVFIIFRGSQAHKSFGLLGSQLLVAYVNVYVSFIFLFGCLALKGTGASFIDEIWQEQQNKKQKRNFFTEKMTTQAAKDATKQQLLRNSCKWAESSRSRKRSKSSKSKGERKNLIPKIKNNSQKSTPPP